MRPSPGPQPNRIFVSVYENYAKLLPSHYSKRNIAKANARELFYCELIVFAAVSWSSSPGAEFWMIVIVYG